MADGLSEELTALRDEAHRLSQEALAAEESNATRNARARELKSVLSSLRGRNEGQPTDARAANEDVARVAERYLIYLLKDEPVVAPSDLKQRAQALHEEVIAAARDVAAGRLSGGELEARASALSAKFNAIIDDPGRDAADIAGLLGDVDLDLEYVFQAGQAPTSLRLARELRE